MSELDRAALDRYIERSDDVDEIPNDALCVCAHRLGVHAEDDLSCLLLTSSCSCKHFELADPWCSECEVEGQGPGHDGAHWLIEDVSGAE